MLNAFVFLLIFLAPINLFFKFQESSAYVHGIFVDYLVVKLYLVEVVVAGFLLWWVVKNVQQKKLLPKIKILFKFLKKNIFLSLLILILLIKQFFAPKPIVGLWQFVRFLEFGLLGFILWENRKKINKKIVKLALIATIIFQSTLGLIQFVKQKPLLPYRFLGETQFTRSINTSRVDFKLSQKIPPHGTTSHPNILAGVLVIYGIILLENFSNKEKEKWGYSLIITISLMIFLTQSYSAILALVFYLTTKSFPKLKKQQWKIFFGLIIAIPILINFGPKYFSRNTSLTRRADLNQQATQIFFKKPLLGIGLGQFTAQLNQRGGEVVRFIQPTHHVGLLWLTETGLLGVILITMLSKKIINKKQNQLWIISLIPIIALDHYLLTQWVGLWFILSILIFFDIIDA